MLANVKYLRRVRNNTGRMNHTPCLNSIEHFSMNHDEDNVGCMDRRELLLSHVDLPQMIEGVIFIAYKTNKVPIEIIRRGEI